MGRCFWKVVSWNWGKKMAEQSSVLSGEKRNQRSGSGDTWESSCGGPRSILLTNRASLLAWTHHWPALPCGCPLGPEQSLSPQ